MKKLALTLSLLTALLCSCSGSLDPTNNTPEEPLIRGNGIEDRIYLPSEDGNQNESTCIVTIEDNKIILTLSEASSFIVYIWHKESASFFFHKRYSHTTAAYIDLSDFPNGNYTLYINEQGVFKFSIKDGVADTTNISKEGIIDWNELYRITHDIPEDACTTSMMGYAGQTTWVLGDECTLFMDEDCNFCPQSDNSYIGIKDLGNMESLSDISLNGISFKLDSSWVDKAPIQPMHGYIITYADKDEYDSGRELFGQAFIRLFVLDFSIDENNSTTGYMQYQNNWVNFYYTITPRPHAYLFPFEDISNELSIVSPSWESDEEEAKKEVNQPDYPVTYEDMRFSVSTTRYHDVFGITVPSEEYTRYNQFMKEKCQQIDTYINKRYEEDGVGIGAAYTYAGIREGARIYADVPLFGREEGASLNDKFIVKPYSNATCIIASYPDFNILYNGYEEKLPTDFDEVFKEGTAIFSYTNRGFVFSFKEIPEERYDAIRFTIEIPVEGEYFQLIFYGCDYPDSYYNTGRALRNNDRVLKGSFTMHFEQTGKHQFSR